jgi:hypothetical protein
MLQRYATATKLCVKIILFISFSKVNSVSKDAPNKGVNINEAYALYFVIISFYNEPGKIYIWFP